MLQQGVIFLVLLLIAVLLILLSVWKKLKDSRESRKRVAEKIEQLNRELAELRLQITNYQKERDALEKTLTSDAVQYFEEELQHIGAEIHDDLIQRIAEHGLMMHKLYLTDDIAELQAIGLRLKSGFKGITNSVRRISKRMLPDNLVEGSFTNSIRGLCMQLETTKLILHFETSGKEMPIPADHALQLYRIVQELIHNTSKHSLAWHLWVRVNWTERLEIQLEDDGFVDNIDQAISSLSSFRTLRLRALRTDSKISFAKAKRGMLITVKYNENVGVTLTK